MKVYVVTAPAERRGIYETWEACRAAVRGVAGARYQAVSSRQEAETMLRGEAVTLAPGLHAFVDGNHEGGIGVVIADKPAHGPVDVREASALTVDEAFAGAGITGLASPAEIRAALGRIRNILAELGGLYAALSRVPDGARVTVVHDYEGVGAWMTGRWRTKDPVVTAIIAACRVRAADRGLTVAFRHQPSHRSTFAGASELVELNRRADALATDAARRRA